MNKPPRPYGSAFGLLAHRARPVTPALEAQAKQQYMAARQARKRQGGS